MKINIAFIGKVSSGKSSVINSLLGGFFSNVSLLRETRQILKYRIKNTKKSELIKDLPTVINKMNTILEEINSKSTTVNSDLTKPTFAPETIDISDKVGRFPSMFLPNITLIDYPGVDDSDDVNNIFYKLFVDTFKKANIIVYVTDAFKAFNDKSEMELFDKIHKLISDYNNEGNYIELVVLFNKYDRDESDLDTMYLNVVRKLNDKVDKSKIIKYSPFEMFYRIVNTNAVTIPYPATMKEKIHKESRKIFRSVGKLDEQIVTDSQLKFFSFLNNIEYAKDVSADEFVKYISNSNPNIESGMRNSYKKYMNGLVMSITDYCNKNLKNPKYNFNYEEHPTILKDFKDFCKKYNEKYAIDVQIIVNSFIDVSITKSINSEKKYIQYLHVTLMFIGFSLEKKLSISPTVKTLFTNPEILPTSFFRELIYYACCYVSSFPYKIPINALSFLFSENEIYGDDLRYLFYSVSDNKVYSGRHKEKESKVNWYIERLLNTSAIPESAKYLLCISKLSMTTIKYAATMDRMPYYKFEEDFPQIKRNLKYSILMRTDIKFHELFKKNEEEEKHWIAFNPFTNE